MKDKSNFYIGAMMNARIVATWDGTHIWLQWESPDAEIKYEIRLQFRKVGASSNSENAGWSDWSALVYPSQNWIVIPVRQPVGTLVKAQIRVRGSQDDWVTFDGAKFVRSICKFAFSTTTKPLHFLKGVRFHCHVDGSVCTYRLKDEVGIEPGETKEVEMEAEASGGYSQLDAPGDFLLRPMFGVIIRNTESSRNDIEVTGKDFSRIEPAKRDGSFGLAFLPRENVR